MEFSKQDLEFLENNGGVKEFIESYAPFYKKYFCFTDEDVETLIAKLISTHDQDLILNLLDLYENFINTEMEILDAAERQRLAKKAVNLSIDFYAGEKTKALEEFRKILRNARSLGIDPIKLVNKTTLTKASYESYNRCIEALQNQLYTDPILQTKFSLLDSSDDTSGSIGSFVEQCTTMICKTNKENVQEVINLLADFFYDKESDTYILQAKDAVLKVKTLLTTSPEKLKENMDYLEDLFTSPSISSIQIKTAIARCPSSLLISKSNLTGFMQAFKSNLLSIIDKANNSTDKLSANELMQMFNSSIMITDDDIKSGSKTYLEFIDDVTKTFCLENLANIYTMNAENVNDMPKFNEIFIRPFGVKNSISCLQDFNFLSTDPDLLNYIFSIAEQSERAGHKNLREFILRHSARSVKLAKEIRNKSGEDKPNDFAEQLTATPKRKRTLYSLPKLPDDVKDPEIQKHKLSNSQIKTAEKLLEQIIAESRDSKDLDIELIDKLEKTPFDSTPFLTMLRRAETAIHHKRNEPLGAKAYKYLENFISVYGSYILSLSKTSKQYEQAKQYYEDKRAVPKPSIDEFEDVDGLSMTDSLDMMAERSSQIYIDKSNISKVYKNLCSIYAQMLKNPYVNPSMYEEQITKLLGKNKTIFNIEAASFSFLGKIMEVLEKLYPEKAMEILGEENLAQYKDYPFISTPLVMYLLLVGYKNSNFLYVVRKGRNFEKIPFPSADLKRTNPSRYNKQLKQHNFEEAYLEIEKIINENITNFNSKEPPTNFSVSPHFRSVTTGNITLVCARLSEDDYDEDDDDAFEHQDSYCDVFPLTAKGIAKIIKLSPRMIEYIQSDKELTEEEAEEFFADEFGDDE